MLTVQNLGPEVAYNVEVLDELPEGLTVVSIHADNPDFDFEFCGLSGDCYLGTLLSPSPGPVTVATITLVAQVDPDYAGTTIANLAYVTSDLIDYAPANNIASAQITVASVPRYMQYLPLILKSSIHLPDLVVSFSLEPNRLTFSTQEDVLVRAVVTNRGGAPAGPFWVDLYLNPGTMPSTNMLWSDHCTLEPCYGIAWYVPAGLAPGDSITLVSTPDSDEVAQSFWVGALAPGTTDLYMYVDSHNPGVARGMVQEHSEVNNLAELHGLVVTGTAKEAATTSCDCTR